MTYQVGIIGARGYVGQELINGILVHPELNLSWLSSRQLAGSPLGALVPEASSHELIIEALEPEDLSSRPVDVLVLALPNGFAKPYVAAAEGTRLIIDLSADYRFSDDWIYSVPELNAERLTSSPIRISNPGCYATAMQAVIAPIRERLDGAAHCFGISGYSGAGTRPSPNNDPENLADNILPYKLVEHLHEQEVSRHMGCAIHFSPHVAAFFRGINMTVQWRARVAQSVDELVAHYQSYYQAAHYIQVQQTIPNIQQVVHSPNCIVGGFSVSQDGMNISIVSALDNLAKGAASQAMQNINLALGLDESLGIDDFYNGDTQ